MERSPAETPADGLPPPSDESVAPAAASRHRTLFSAACIGLLYGVFHGALRWWSGDGAILIPSGTLLAIFSGAVALGVLFGVHRAKPGPIDLAALIDPMVLAIAIPFVLLSDWLTVSYSLFQGPSIRGEIFAGALLSFGSIAIFRSVWPLVLGWAAIAPLVLLGTFLGGADGRLLFSDDHAAMMYRLAVLTENFPRIPTYNVMWNAGLDARDFFATGVLNFYLLIRPFVDPSTLLSRYTPLVGVILFAMLPLSTYAAARLLAFSCRAAAVSSLLSVASTLVWYRWGLKYGAMGFVTSVALLPLTVAIVLRLLDESKEPSRRLCAGAVLTVTLVLLWSMNGVVLLPLILLAALQANRLLRKRQVAIAALLLLALNLPWMALFLQVSQVTRFLVLSAPGYEEQAAEADHRAAAEGDEKAEPVKAPLLDANAIRGGHGSFTFASMQRSVRTAGTSVNPLLLFFGLPGLLLLRPGAMRRGLVLLCGWLALLGVVIAPLKPQLELDRMLVIMFVVLTLPAGRAIELLLDRVSLGSSLSSRLLGALTASMLLVGTGAAGAAARNRSLEGFFFASGEVDGLAGAIASYGGEGRTLFTGFVLHELSGGHLAPLAHMVKRPLIASSPVHNKWWYTDVVPEEFRKRGDEGITRYFDLMNVTAVIAHEPLWRKYLEDHPGAYALRWKGRKFRLYERLHPSGGYFLEGAGEIRAQTTGGVTVVPASESVVLKFNYLPFLEADGCAKLEPFTEGESVSLIKLSGCTPGRAVTIRSVSPWRRLSGSW